MAAFRGELVGAKPYVFYAVALIQCQPPDQGQGLAVEVDVQGVECQIAFAAASIGCTQLGFDADPGEPAD